MFTAEPECGGFGPGSLLVGSRQRVSAFVGVLMPIRPELPQLRILRIRRFPDQLEELALVRSYTALGNRRA